ncbi:MAG: hypothetical protein K0R66_311 [Gammaproteobacteria bacterium]|nr:hypothetical protein [Gammaproteobacteria bacterium]
MQWKVIYLEDVEAWLLELSKEQFKSVAKEMRLLELSGAQLRLPHSRTLGGGLFELRERGFGLRIYYAFNQERTAVLLHAGDKSDQLHDIMKARRLLKRYRGNTK